MSNLQRIAVLVDVHNLFFSAKNCGGKINYEKLLTEICDGRTLIRAIAYIVQKAGIEQKGFLTALTKFGYELRIKEQDQKEDPTSGKVFYPKATQEIEITLEAVKQVERVDCIALVTGSGIYTPVVEYIQSRGCKVEVVGFEGATSLDLIKKSNKFIPIKKDWLFENQQQDEQPQPQTPVIINDAIPAVPTQSEFDERQPESNASRLGPKAATAKRDLGIFS